MKKRRAIRLAIGGLRPQLRLVTGVGLVLTCCQAQAFSFDLGDSDFTARWDNTLRYNVGMRTQEQDGLVNRAGGGAYDQSNALFDRGNLVTNRLDLLSEFDLRYQQNYGLRVSAAAWYDDAYDGNAARTANTSYSEYHYNSTVKRFYRGPSGEILDAYVFGTFDVIGRQADVRLGQHSVIWGEGLFGNTNAISYAQSPNDSRKATANPGASAKETALPVNQISTIVLASDEVNIAAQYTFDWKPNRIPEGGTFYAGADNILEGPDIWGYTGSGAPIYRGKDIKGHGGDYGVLLRWRPDWFDGTLGAVYRNFDEKAAWVSQADALGLRHAVYAEDVDLYGLTLSTVLGGVSVGAELSYRQNMPLNSSGTVTRGDRLEGAKGSTVHGLVNGVMTFGDNLLSDSASLSGELTWSHLDKVTSNPQAYRAKGYNAGCASGGKMLGCSDDDFFGASLAFTPTWVQVFPSVDLSAPLFISRNLSGNAPTNGGGSEGFTTYKVGISADAYARHKFDLAYTWYTQKTDTDRGLILGAPYKDKAVLSLTYQTTY